MECFHGDGDDRADREALLEDLIAADYAQTSNRMQKLPKRGKNAASSRVPANASNPSSKLHGLPLRIL